MGHTWSPRQTHLYSAIHPDSATEQHYIKSSSYSLNAHNTTIHKVFHTCPCSDLDLDSLDTENRSLDGDTDLEMATVGQCWIVVDNALLARLQKFAKLNILHLFSETSLAITNSSSVRKYPKHFYLQQFNKIFIASGKYLAATKLTMSSSCCC